jgi:hypothetical protein
MERCALVPKHHKQSVVTQSPLLAILMHDITVHIILKGVATPEV